MATLQVRDIDDSLYNALKVSAKMQHRSISQEVVTIIQEHLNASSTSAENATLAFLGLTGGWDDTRDAETIISDIRKNRRNSQRFRSGNGLFD